VQNRLGHQGRPLRRLAQVLALAVLVAGVVPATAAGTDANAARQTTQIQSSVGTWSLVGTIDPMHVFSANVQLQFWGAYIFTANGVQFNPHVIPTSVRQIIVPFVRVPDSNSHTYKLVFHLRTNGTTTTRYQLDNRAPVDVANGAVTVEFTDTVQVAHAAWWYWSVGNANGDPWDFFSCDIYEQIN
jgi:hypothetical protein